MSKTPSKTLTILFSMERRTIDRDLESAEGEIVVLAGRISALFAIPVALRTPEIDARLAHLLMVQAHELCRNETLQPELKTFYAAFGAGYVAQDAEHVAAGKDTLANLSIRIDAIRRREGLADDEYWTRNQGPADYCALDAEFDRIVTGISEMVFAFALRRYRLENCAELYEQDRVTFEIKREVGRRIISPARGDTAAIEKLMDDYCRKQYGPDALHHVKVRTKQLRAEME